jgi:hypothetical protein
MLHIPSVNCIRFRLQRTTGNQCIIDSPAKHARLSSLLDRGKVFVTSERDQRKTLSDVPQKEQDLLTT